MWVKVVDFRFAQILIRKITMKNNVIKFPTNTSPKKDSCSDFGEIKILHPSEYIQTLSRIMTGLEKGDEITLTLEEWEADKKNYNIASRLDSLINHQISTKPRNNLNTP
jgi:hypothetical protein